MRLKFDARARAILRRLPVVNVYSVFELALLAGLATQAARLTWAIVTPVSPLGAWVPAAPAAVADVGAVLGGFDPFFRVSGAAPAGPAAVTSLQLTLFGTRMDAAQGRGSAIIAGPDGVQQAISVGDEVAPGVTLKAVAFDHVTLDRGGVSEDLFLDQSGATGAATPPAAGAPPVAPGAAPPLPPAGGNGLSVDQLRADTNVIPRIDGGKISGLVVRGQGGSAFGAAGLRDGDVVTAVGGAPVQGPADLERLTRAAAGSGSLSITVERGGQTVPITVPVTR